MKLFKWYWSLNPTPFHLGCTKYHYLHYHEETWKHFAKFMRQVYLMFSMVLCWKGKIKRNKYHSELGKCNWCTVFKCLQWSRPSINLYSETYIAINFWQHWRISLQLASQLYSFLKLLFYSPFPPNNYYCNWQVIHGQPRL